MLTRLVFYAARHRLAMPALFVALGGTSFAAPDFDHFNPGGA